MKKLIRINYLIVFICFFLPFTLPMCEQKAESSSGADTAKAEVDTLPDTVNDTIKTSETIQKDNASTSDADFNSKPHFIFSPDGHNLSGIGYLYEYSIAALVWVAIPEAFIMLLFSLLFRDKKIRAVILTIGLCHFLCKGIFDVERVLYGYWVAVTFYTTLVFLAWRHHRKIVA